jgi:DNA topoisomerase VI subunit B
MELKFKLILKRRYQKGSQSVDEYLKETAVVNPHVTIIYTNPKAEQLDFS